MLKIGLFPNMNKQNVITVLGRMIQHFKERGVEIVLPEKAANELGYPELAYSNDGIRNDISLGITLGGDGTLLNTAREVAAAGVPICGVNMGQLGFLTEIELPELTIALDKIINAEYRIEDRLMLDAMVVRNDKNIYVSSALNDIVVSKGGFSRLIRLGLYIDGKLTANYPADGLIIATSTGSTGYSLSAGGPIVNPNLNVIVLTPICPHTLQTRSLIVSAEESVQVKMQATHNDIMLTVDGQTVYSLLPDDEVLVKSSPFRAKFIRFNGKSYYETLRAKLRRGDIGS